MEKVKTKFISNFLGLTDFDDNRDSCLVLALKSARKHTGRNINTGDIKDGLLNEEIFKNQMYISEYFTGITNYLILLEQVGLVFKKVGDSNSDIKNGIQLALDTFQNIDDDKQIKAIRFLRNTLAHNFGLATDDNSNKKFKFSLSFDENQDFVKIQNDWDGVFSAKSEDTNTIIGVIKLCDLIESTIANVQGDFSSGNLELRISDLTEIMTRFTIRY